jgi:hypothetical protein
MANEEEEEKKKKNPVEIKPDPNLKSRIAAYASSVKDKGKERKTETIKYYHLCSYPLREGSIVEKGNWGRIIQKNPNFQQLSKNLRINSRFSSGVIFVDPRDQYIIRELIFERVRKEEFPHAPSRLNCIFVCKTCDGAKSFKSEQGRNLDLIYEVEPTDVNSRMLETDWSLINSIINKPLHEIEENARKYWCGVIQNPDKKELLWDCGVRILHNVDV